METIARSLVSSDNLTHMYTVRGLCFLLVVGIQSNVEGFSTPHKNISVPSFLLKSFYRNSGAQENHY